MRIINEQDLLEFVCSFIINVNSLVWDSIQDPFISMMMQRHVFLVLFFEKKIMQKYE